MKALFFLLLFTTQVPPVVPGLPTGPIPTTCAVPTPRRESTVLKFHRLTGYPHGRPGFVVDHIIPLCACGADAVTNMQWQTVADASLKDAWEKTVCRALRRKNK